MKKIFVLLSLFLLCACGESTAKNDFYSDFNVILDELSVIKCYDDHGGLQNDGEALYEIPLRKQPKLNHWDNLPLPADLMTHIYNNSSMNKQTLEKILLLDQGNYLKVNREKDNYSLAIYDKKSNTIYYYKFDI